MTERTSGAYAVDHFHTYDLANWPEGRCACGDLGMYPPIEQAGSDHQGRTLWAPLPVERGPAFWCQVCGSHFMTAKWAYDHYKQTSQSGEVHVIVQLRQEG